MKRRLARGSVVVATIVATLPVVFAASFPGRDWTAAWSTGSNLAPIRERAAATYLPSTCQAVQFGGVGINGVPTDTTYIYTPASDSWLQLRAQKGTGTPGARSFARLTWDADHSVAVLFGGYGSPTLNSSYLFDPITSKWSAAVTAKCTASTCPAPRYAHAQAWSGVLGETLVFGGKDSPSIFYGDLWALSAVPARRGGLTWVWRRLDPVSDPAYGMPEARAFHRMVEVPSGPDQGKLLIYGGNSVNSDGSTRYLPDTWLYDPRDNTFEYVDTLPPTATQLFAMGVSPSLNAVVITGGWAPKAYVTETWAFDDLAREWVRITTSLEPGARMAHDLVSDPYGGCHDDRAFVFSAPVSQPRVADYTWFLR